MDHIPDFKVNDYVRIMQTRDMEDRGFANVKGRIISIDPTAQTAQIFDETFSYHNIPLSSLTKV